VVDEVLAVGDAAFQKKCLGKMGTVARHGRTVLFVSHNMGAVVSLCSRALLLDGGRLVLESDPITVAARYQATLTAAPTATSDLSGAEHFGSGKARFVSLRFVPERRDGTTREMMCPGSRLRVETRIVCSASVDSANVGITIYDASGYRLVDANTAMQGRFVSMSPGDEARVDFALDDLRLKPGVFPHDEGWRRIADSWSAVSVPPRNRAPSAGGRVPTGPTPQAAAVRSVSSRNRSGSSSATA